MQRDSIANTFIIAVGVCLVCSFLVSSAAVGLKPLQDRNVDEDRKKNILQAAGFSQEDIDEAGGVFDLFKLKVEPIIVKLETGIQEGIQDIVDSNDKDKIKTVEDAINLYDQIEAAKKKLPGLYTSFENKKDDLAGISNKEIWSHVYLIKGEADAVEKYVFPIRGKGLWSILKGFIAVENDFQTIAGLTYYEHGETPGLGGEVDNKNWKSKWVGKLLFDDSGDVGIEVIKGIAEPEDKYAIDGLSGATITSRGVTNMLQFWLGPQGFGPYIQNQKNGSMVSAKLNSGEQQ